MHENDFKRLISSPLSQDPKSSPTQKVKVSVRHLSTLLTGSRTLSVARAVAVQRKERRRVIISDAFLSTSNGYYCAGIIIA